MGVVAAAGLEALRAEAGRTCPDTPEQIGPRGERLAATPIDEPDPTRRRQPIEGEQELADARCR